MSNLSRRHQLLAIYITLASILYRGLIPAGLMPATGEAAKRGAVLVVCPHGDMAMPGHDGHHPHGASMEQCPFGVAAGPALTSAAFLLSGISGNPGFRPDWIAIQHQGASLRLQPPARAPPIYS